MSRSLLLFCVYAACLATALPRLPAQSVHRDETRIPVNIRVSAARANAPPGTCGCFFLTGGAADAAMPWTPRLLLAVEAAGHTVNRVQGTDRGLSTITLLAGPRYTMHLGRIGFSGQTLFGAARGFDADFILGAHRADTATAFGMALGGFAEVGLTRSLALRAVQVDYLQTNLPNGQDDRQRNIRLGAGLTFRLPSPSVR